MPSPRDIPQVKHAWSKLPYDKLIIKYKPQHIAYLEAKQFFLDHAEYDRLVICADDLVIKEKNLENLLSFSDKFKVLDGLCNIDESQPDTYACQPLNCNLKGDKPETRKGAWFSKEHIPKLPTNNRFLEVGHSGAVCRIIQRETFKKLSFEGGNENKTGWFDFGMSKELEILKIPIMVDTVTIMEHLRTAQKPINDYGYTIWQQR